MRYFYKIAETTTLTNSSRGAMIGGVAAMGLSAPAVLKTIAASKRKLSFGRKAVAAAGGIGIAGALGAGVGALGGAVFNKVKEKTNNELESLAAGGGASAAGTVAAIKLIRSLRRGAKVRRILKETIGNK